MTNEELIISYKEGNKKALDELVAANQGIISKIANKYYGINKKLEFEDLTQAGNVGLMKAIDKYDSSLEVAAKFITYAVFWIDKYINIEVNGCSSRDVENTKLNNSCTSLNQFIGDDNDTELIEMIESDSDDIVAIEDKLYHEYLRKSLENAMMKSNSLEEREVLKFRYGWNAKRMTLDEVGNVLNISTRYKVRALESKAMRRLRSNKWVRRYGKEMYIKESSSYVSLYNDSAYSYIDKKIDLLIEDMFK